MTDSDQGRSRTRSVALLLGLLLLIALVMGTCRFGGHEKSSPTATAPQPKFKAGIEVVGRDEAAGLITLRDKRTGDTVQINSAGISDEKVDQAFARLIATRQKAAPPATAPVVVSAPADASPRPAPVAQAPEEKSSGSLTSTRADKPAVTAPPAPEASLPSFVPQYPGATTISIATTHDGGSIHGDYEFSTADSPGAVGKFYGDKTTAGSLLILANVAGSNQDGPTFTLIAEDSGTGKTLSLTAVIESGRTRGSITFAAK
jgi:hypothetical protein